MSNVKITNIRDLSDERIALSRDYAQNADKKETKTMKNSKVTTWFKEHKKEILVGAASIAGTVVLMKTKKFSVKSNISLYLSLIDGEEDDGYYSADECINLSSTKPDLKISDLGNLGRAILDRIPELSKDSAVNRINFNYSVSHGKNKKKGLECFK